MLDQVFSDTSKHVALDSLWVHVNAPPMKGEERLDTTERLYTDTPGKACKLLKDIDLEPWCRPREKRRQCPMPNSLTRSFVHSFIRSFIHSFIFIKDRIERIFLRFRSHLGLALCSVNANLCDQILSFQYSFVRDLRDKYKIIIPQDRSSPKFSIRRGERYSTKDQECFQN